MNRLAIISLLIALFCVVLTTAQLEALPASNIPSFQVLAATATHRTTYTIDNTQCIDSPVCCCAHGSIIIDHGSGVAKRQIRILAHLDGGPNCGGKANVDGLFDIVNANTAIFRDPTSPLQVKAELNGDFTMIKFSNSLQACASVGKYSGGDPGKNFNTLSNPQHSHNMFVMNMHHQNQLNPFLNNIHTMGFQPMGFQPRF